MSRVRQLNANNLHTLRTSPLSELSGSLGDLGTLLPLLTALALIHAISLPSTLLFTGFANIFTGVCFGIPLPVQPMKAIAAVALARNFSMEEMAASGIVVASVIGIMSITGMIAWVSRVVPIPVVKGIQVGAGLSLCLSAGSTLLGPLGWTGPSWADNLLWALFAFLALLFSMPFPRFPYALAVFVLGLVLAIVQLHTTDASPTDPSHPTSRIPILLPSPATFWHATTTAALGQLPLTLLNSIIAVTHLSADLLPALPTPSAPEIGLSVAVMNLAGAWFGAMPTCHGSGGLAAQYRFGARSGGSVIVLGAVKVALGVVALAKGDAVVSVLRRFPKAVLGVMVLAAGVELAKVGESLNFGARDLREDGNAVGEFAGRKRARELGEEERKERWMVMMVTVAGLLAFRNDGIGFVAGMMWHWGIQLTKRLEGRKWVPQSEDGEETGSLLGRR